jgi:hypothetical protein
VPSGQRHPERTAFYQCLEDYWEEFKASYRYFYERDFGSLRPVVDKTVDRFSSRDPLASKKQIPIYPWDVS